MPDSLSPDDLVAKTFTEVSNSFDQAENRLGQLKTDGRRSFCSTQSGRSASPEPVRRPVPRRDMFRLSKVDGSRVVTKMDKELVVKKVITMSSRGLLARQMDELFPVESVPSTPSSAAPALRVGRNHLLLTSTITLPFARNIDSERVFCFRSDGLGSSVDMKMPLVPEGARRVSHVDKPTIAEPYLLNFYRKIHHKKDRTTVIEAVEMRTVGTVAEADTEVFSEPMDRKTERMAYEERIFVGAGVIRFVTEFTVNSRDLGFTQITRHFWKTDLTRVEPFLSTAKEYAATSARAGSISDTSAGSPPSTNSPFSKMQRTDKDGRPLASTAAVSPGSKVQEILQRRRGLNDKRADRDTNTALSPGRPAPDKQ